LAIARFQQEGLLVPYAPTQDDYGNVDRILITKDLKEMLRARGLKVSGRKEELIRRLLASAPEMIAEAAATQGLLRCSESGAALAQQYVERRKAVEILVETALRAGDTLQAIRAHETFRKGLGFPRWDADELSVQFELRTILEKTPKALSRCQEAEIPAGRIRAAMVQLGVKQPRDLPEYGEIEDILICYAMAQSNLRSWRQSGCVRSVRVLGSADGSCPQCRKLQARVWPLSRVPELPHPGCTSEGGCCCALTADVT
jgi:hypothetical protein